MNFKLHFVILSFFFPFAFKIKFQKAARKSTDITRRRGFRVEISKNGWIILII